ncbi:hypothetical protein Trydic_g10509 [Trypoxylus dichotomus]
MLKNIKIGQTTSGAKYYGPTDINYNCLDRKVVNMFDDELEKLLQNHVLKLSLQGVGDIMKIEAELIAEKYQIILEQYAISNWP